MAVTFARVCESHLAQDSSEEHLGAPQPPSPIMGPVERPA